MIIVDTALRRANAPGSPIRVGMVGAGFMGQGLTNQIVNSVPGMRMVAVSNRHLTGRSTSSSTPATRTRSVAEHAGGAGRGDRRRPAGRDRRTRCSWRARSTSTYSSR